MAELKEERDSVSFEERGPVIKQHLTDYLEAQADEKRRRRADAARVIRAHYRDKEQAEAIVGEIRRNLETCLTLDGWEPKDIKVLLDTKPPRQYATVDMYTVPVYEGPRLSEAYSWGIGRDGRYRLFDLHEGQVAPEVDPDPPPSPEKLEITLNLSEVYGSWKTPKGDVSLRRFDDTIPGGETQKEEE
jgi:hypothetical protein